MFLISLQDWLNVAAGAADVVDDEEVATLEALDVDIEVVESKVLEMLEVL